MNIQSTFKQRALTAVRGASTEANTRNNMLTAALKGL